MRLTKNGDIKIPLVGEKWWLWQSKHTEVGMPLDSRGNLGGGRQVVALDDKSRSNGIQCDG